MSDSHSPQAFQAPEPAALAPLFPGYEIESLIASGGMGAVYCAVQKSLDRTVALKILPMELSHDASFCAGFEAEAKAMARLNHPNLIGVYDFGEVGGMLYIIMEYVPGKSVYDSAYGIAIDPAEVVRLMMGICDGLAHAHESGIIHRDIKPANILLDLSAQPKIGDFGLARSAERKFEEGEGIFGTPHYTAPEVIDNPHAVDFRADIFSVGVMLHELLTSRLPANDPRPASTIVNCDPRFDHIIRRATQPDPIARYASAKDLAHDLRVIGDSIAQKNMVAGAIGGPRPQQASIDPSRNRSKRSGVLLFAGYLLFLGIVGVGAYFFYFQKKLKSSSAETYVVLPPTAPVFRSNDAAITPEVTLPSVKPPSETTGKLPESDTSSVDTPAEEIPETEAEATTSDDSAEPMPPTEVAPKFDVASFFARARKIMQEKSKSELLINETRKERSRNLSEFEREAKRIVRKEFFYKKERIDTAIENEIKSWDDADSRIPKNGSKVLYEIPGISEITEKHLKIQTEIDEQLYVQLDSHRATYILGLEKQIERLKSDNDVGAIALIESEISSTNDAPQYFRNLLIQKSSSN